MSVTSTTKSIDTLTFTITAEFDAAVERVWQVWADPCQLERWWGPPTWPARFEDFDFQPGGKASYFMTGPDGTKARGWWVFTAISAPTHLEFDDGFADDDGRPVSDLGTTHAVVTLEDADGRSLMTITSTFDSEAQMQQMVDMGMVEGMTEAMGQIDAILAS